MPPVGLFADCAGVFGGYDHPHRDLARFARPLLAQAYGQGRAVLAELLARFHDDDHPLPHGQAVTRWAASLRLGGRRRHRGGAAPPAYATCDCHGWWVLALADNLADLEQRARIAPGWTGGPLPWTPSGGETDEPGEDEQRASLDSVPGAVAAATQLLRWGAPAPARPTTWAELVEGLWRAAQSATPFQVPVEIGAWHGPQLPGSDLSIQVARRYTDLNSWAAYMGNCIAGYAEEGESGECVLLALREPGEQIRRQRRPAPREVEVVRRRGARALQQRPLPRRRRPPAGVDAALPPPAPCPARRPAPRPTPRRRRCASSVPHAPAARPRPAAPAPGPPS